MSGSRRVSPPDRPRDGRTGPAITILDYGMGNLRSVEKAFERTGARVTVSAGPDPAGIRDGLVLPGVGAFPRAMERIREAGLDHLVRDSVAGGIPLLGICLGLQLLFEGSDEHGGAEGLGLLPGRVTPVPAGGRKVPHIGWSPVTWKKPDPLADGLRPGEPFYFVHSFACRPAPGDVLGTASYGGRFACAAGRDRIRGVQFHPEKSGAAGLRLLANFVNICEGNR